MSPKDKYLFLYLKTGGGHLAPAKAVSSWISQNIKEDISIDLHDGFLGASSMIRRIVEDGYKQSQAKAKWTFELLYAIHKFKPFARFSSWLVNLFVLNPLEEKILELKPSKIVIFHFFLIKPVQKILEKHNLDIPVIKVVTDPFTAHPLWFLNKKQHFIVFSNQLKLHMIHREKIESKRISVFPFTISPKFSQPASVQQQLAIRGHLGLDPDSKVVLLMGGADGLPRAEKLLKEFALTNIDADIVIVCGKNIALRRKALRIKRKFGLNRLHVLGFVEFVYELISIAEVVVTKCGASTFMEILLCGKIPLVNSYIWEQEKGNVEFITNNGLGVFEPNAKRIVHLTSVLISDSILSDSYKNNLKRMTLQNGTSHVSEFISKFKIQSNESACNFRLTY